jgi:TonB family protein
MQTGTQRKCEPETGSETNSVAQSSPPGHESCLVELSPHGRLPRLDLGIDWESPWREFRSSVGQFFSGQRAPRRTDLPADSALRVHWVGGKNSAWAFLASLVWHVIVILLLLLPIGGFLPATEHNLAPVEIQVNWDAAQDLPPIHLPTPRLAAPSPKRSALPIPKLAEDQPPAQNGAERFHPHQTILSIPVRVTHPRQTLIQPDAPMAPPKIEPDLPNIVEWAANAPVPKPQLQLSPSAAAPKMQQRAVTDRAAPEVANLEKDSGPLNIAASPVVNPAPQMPMAPMAAAVRTARHARADSAEAAPEVGAASGDPNLRSVIALSASPAPPAPVVAVPQGNLAARVAISPAGQVGAPGGTGNAVEGSSSGSGGNGSGAPDNGAGAGGTGSLPAAVSVSRGKGQANASGAGGLRASQPGTKLMLKPMGSLPEKPEPVSHRKDPPDIGDLGANEPPEKILSGKEVYTLNINLPNVTSISGSWILNFAQLDEEASPFSRPKGVLSGPVPIRKVDPKYSAEAIRENIEGEVVLYAIIRADGTIDSIQLVRKLDPLVDVNAVRALAQWEFRPATRDGAPVDIEAVVHIPFKCRLPQQ